MDVAIAETIYHERRRIEKEKASRKRDARFRKWDQRCRALFDTQAASPAGEAPSPKALVAKKELLEEIARDFASEILGNFDPRVYRFSTRLVPHLLSGLLNAFSPTRLVKSFPEMPSV